MELFALLLVLGLIATLILPWVNMARIRSQRTELNRLKRELWELRNKKDAAVRVSVAPEKKVEPAKGTMPRETPVAVTREEAPKVEVLPAEVFEPTSGNLRVKAAPADSEHRARQESGDPGNARLLSGSMSDQYELKLSEPAEPQDWFSKIAVWVGGIALLMAGFYMIKYSIESGWLTPVVRIWLTTSFGALLCVAGFVIGIKSAMAVNERIGQALSGAGIACLYFAAYAAVHLYGFLSPGQGFVAMLGVTVLAVALSLKNGAPIAMMGLVGGFLTPWLMSTGSNDTAILFSYLFLLFCGAQFLCVRRGWWALLLASLVGAYLWSALVIVGNWNGTLDNLEGTLIFVLGICLVNAVWTFLAKQDSLDQRATFLLTTIRLMTWGGGLAQGLVLVLIGGFAAVDMALFGLLSVGALVLAVLKEDDFIWAAWLALAAVAAATVSNVDATLWNWLVAPTGLMGLFFAGGHWRGLSSGRVLAWRSISVVAAVMVVPLLYLNREWVVGLDAPLGASIWLWMAAVWAGLLALAGEHLFRRDGDAEVAGHYSAFAVFLLGFGLWTYVPDDYLAHTAAGLLIGSALYWKRRAFGRSSLVMSVLGVAWGALMHFHAGDAYAYFFRQEIHNAPEQDGLAVLAWALGLVGASTVFGCFYKAWSESSRKVVTWSLGLVGLLAFVATYQWLDQSYMPTEWTGATVEGGLTALLALAAVGAVFLAGKWSQTGGWRSPSAGSGQCRERPESVEGERNSPELLSAGFPNPGNRVGAILAGLVGLRVVVLHLGDAGAEGESFFLNALILQFGVPFMAACILAWQSGEGGCERLRRAYQLAGMLLGFVWVTFLVQDYFGGSELFGGPNSSTEIYTYSVVWLLLAVAYQAIGLWRNQSAIHVGSLILLLITIGKVFLVDASELEGLFRVLSFLGLGLALIGIGFFYNKVVFARREAGGGS